MLHLGDITKINGHHVPIVDCVIGGSPCQGLSVAGLGKGLDDERSGLFIEQVRIAKEMREADVRNGRSGHDIRPRYMVWENVPGAFSSNGGEDFRVVLEELARVIEEGVTIPRPEKGKWATTGVIIGDNWSLAWRVFDAQYWGVPQRRRRICIVVDFNGHTAPQIVFSEGEHHGSTERGVFKPSLGYLGAKSRPEVQSVSEGLSGHLESSQPQREEAASDASRGLGADDCEGRGQVGIDLYNTDITGDKAATLGINCGMSHGRNGVMAYTMKIRGGCEGGGKGALIQTEKSATLSTLQDQTLFQPVYSIENHPNDSRVGINEDGIVQALTTRMGTGGGNVPMVMQQCYPQQAYDKYIEDDVATTLKAMGGSYGGGSENLVCVLEKPSAVCYGIGAYHSNAWKSKNPDSGVYEADTAKTLDAINCSYPACNQGGMAVVERFETRYIVRRLTPLECERLQGFPDGWTDIGEYTDTNGKKCKSSDASRYKALGNSIALPSWKWVLKRLCANYERDATMCSLFDGIGGFDYLWEQINGKGSCLWASEIEEFPIAVTSRRFNDE